jgi:hypothetical protein
MLYDTNEAEDMLLLGRKALRKLAYRKQLGLPAIKVGKRLLFHSDDIEKVLAAGREPFGVKDKGEEQTGKP